ncbi:MAG: hypothetical protein L3J67_07065 [Hyphomicrobiaceae bacterium]|nr:hypothetical protein [Hyphomicrobiaceae bacterium]
MRIRQVEGETVGQLQDFVFEHFGMEAMAAAWEEFTFDDELGPEEMERPEFESTFIPWVLFNWLADPEDERTAQLREKPVAQYFMERRGTNLELMKRRFIAEACAQPFSFFQVTHVEPGKSLTLRDLFLKREVKVFERQASQSLKRGAILFTRILTLDGQSVMFGCAPTPIPPDHMDFFDQLLESILAEKKSIDMKLMHELDGFLRAAYFDIEEELHNPVMPTLANTDGELVEYVTLNYLLHCTPHETLSALASLSMESEPELLLLEEAEFEGEELVAIEFDWLKKGNTKHGSWDNTIMGHLKIDRDRLTIEVNSVERSEAIRRKITRRLGKRARLEKEERQSQEEVLEEKDTRVLSAKEIAARKENEAFQNSPEGRRLMRETVKNHWRSWFDEPVPLLDDQTPRMAAKTPEGRKLLENLFQIYEYRSDPDDLLSPDIPALRRELGMG